MWLIGAGCWKIQYLGHMQIKTYLPLTKVHNLSHQENETSS